MDQTEARDAIRALLQRGIPWAATDVFRTVVAASADDPELNYWGALALARSGAAVLARRLLDRVLAANDTAPAVRREGLSLSGRLWKDRIDRVAGGGPTGHAAARLARDDYLAAYAIDANPYPGVNAATLSMLLGDQAEAQALAAQLLTALESTQDQTAWGAATRGEALLLVGAMDEACACYAHASALAPDDAGTIASMRKQLRLLARALPDASRVLDILPSAAVIGFAGHMLDAADRPTPRFPVALEPAVAAALRTRLHAQRRSIVYASAACGADLLFVEAALDAGAEVNLVLPFDREDFVRTSVAPAGPDWVVRFDRACASATRLIHATMERYLGDDVLFEYAQGLVDGLVVLRAAQLETDPVMWFVVDEAMVAAPAAVGGTQRSRERWKRTGRSEEVISLDRLRGHSISNAIPEAIPGAVAGAARAVARREARAVPAFDDLPADRPQRTLKATLFADVAGFGRVHDTQAPLFHSRFLGLVAAQIAASRTPPLTANTWGDALYVVFENAADGAHFGLGVIERMRAIDWTETGLDATSGIRVALHCGPVFCGFDPVIGHDNYFGTSVTQTARIEPVTPPGVVYASEAFVATVASQGSTDFVFEYVGELALAKSYGTSRIYAVERR